MNRLCFYGVSSLRLCSCLGSQAELVGDPWSPGGQVKSFIWRWAENVHNFCRSLSEDQWTAAFSTSAASKEGRRLNTALDRFPRPAVYVLSSHSQLNHHFLPTRPRRKRPDEGIIPAEQRPPFKLDSISQQVGGGIHLAAWEGVWMRECPCARDRATSGREGRKIIADPFSDKLNERSCCQERSAVLQAPLLV